MCGLADRTGDRDDGGMSEATRTPRRITILCFPSVQMLDVTGPSEALSIAERIRPGSYDIELLSSRSGSSASARASGSAAARASGSAAAMDVNGVPGACEAIESSSGLKLLPDSSIAGHAGEIDTLLVAGGRGVREALKDELLIEWIRQTAARCKRVASVCTGAFLLAEAGLLDGRKATTHWSACKALASSYPQVSVEIDPIFVRDGNVSTSAGVTAGIDLALSLVEEDLGGEVSLQVAKTLVLFMRRPGGQAQFSSALLSQRVKPGSLGDLQTWMIDHLDADLTVTALSERVHMSPRHFARVFAAETGLTPGRYVESLRLERAQLLLESTARTIEEIAACCGFGTVETLRRAFSRRLAVTPSDYRARFRETAIR